MSNMSYCRFENTLSDMKDCLEMLESSETWSDLDLSNSEKRNAIEMQNVANEISELIDNLQKV
jgi:hypothetical protein